MNLDNLITESCNQATLHIDQLSTLEMVSLINKEDHLVPLAVKETLPQIAVAIDTITAQLRQGGRLLYIGAGTSGRLGILDASECPPTYGVEPELVQGLIAGGYQAVFKAQEGVEDSLVQGEIDLKACTLTAKDVVVGLTASGRTPYVIGALDYANKIGATTIAVACNGSSKLAQIAKIAIVPIVGPEVIRGSTRMKAGTAQKLVLNMLSTGTMIKLGKVYGNLMVDVKPSNEKLQERAHRIVMETTGVAHAEAKIYLNQTNNNVKLAILMILSGLELEVAYQKLSNHQGYIYSALKSLNNGDDML